MILKYLRQQMLLPIEEYIINQRVNIKGIDVLLLSFTIEKDKNCLWMIYENGKYFRDKSDCEDREELRTNREEMLNNIETSNRDKHFHIGEMEIQGNIVNFSSSSSSSIYNMNSEGIMRLQHFIEQGLISKEWDDIELENLIIMECKQMEDEVAPNIDKNQEMSVVLHIHRDIIKIPIQHSFKVEFGKQDIGTKIFYYDKELDKENHFFIDEIYSYDIYEDVQKQFEKIEDNEIRERMFNNFMDGLERICPKGKNLAVIKYETEDNTQLCFHMKDYLEAKLISYNDESSIGGASSIGIICKSDEEIGINGHKVRECVLQSIDKDFKGELEIELFSRYLEIPEEQVRGLECK